MSKPDPPPKGFAKVPHVTCADSEITDAEFRVLCAIVRWSRDQGECWTTRAKIGRQAGGKDERTVRRILRSLAKKGRIAITPDPDKRTHDRIRPLWTPDNPGLIPGQVCPPTPVKLGQEPRSNLSPKEEPLKENPQGTTTITPESSSVGVSPSGSGEGEGIKADPDSPAVAGAIAAARRLFTGKPEAIRAKVLGLVAEGFDPEWMPAALEATAGASNRRGDAWSYFVGILKNNRREGGPVGRMRPQPNSDQTAVEYHVAKRPRFAENPSERNTTPIPERFGATAEERGRRKPRWLGRPTPTPPPYVPTPYGLIEDDSEET